MKISPLIKILAVLAAASFAGLPVTLTAQDTLATNTPAPTEVLAPTPPLSPAALQVLQLAQAKVGDGTILAFVKGSQATYNLTAPAIIFLRQQGVSDAVLTAMLNPATPVMATNLAPATPVPVPSPAPAPVPVPDTADAGYGQPQNVTVVDNSSTTYVETPPADPTVIYQPVYTPYYYPPVVYSVGVYGGYHGGYNGNHGGGNNGGHGGNNGGNNGGHGGYGNNGGNSPGYGAPHH
jgi:hypothetical protein